MTQATQADLSPFQAPATNGNELSQTGAAAAAQHEIQSAIIVAKKFPRNEDLCFQKLMAAARRPSFAEEAKYSFPRGDKDVTGPSVNLAREAARIWGNIRIGLYIPRDDEDTRLARGFAWDLETNFKVELEDDFAKLIQRKVKGGKPGETVWLVPDERDLRELTNRRGAILMRNAILQVLPKDLIADAMYQCEKTLEDHAAQDPDATKKRLLVDFAALNITVEQIEQKLGHALSQSTPKELAELRGICKSIQDGHTTWAEYVKGPEPKPSASEQETNKAKLEEGQRALKEQQAQAPLAEPAPSAGQGEEAKYNKFVRDLRAAETVAVMAEIMNQAMHGPDALLSADARAALTTIKDECLAKMRKKK